MVAGQHYRWDFIGLSTDNKPTPATSEKVVDGSTFYCSDNSKLYVWYNDQWYEKVVSGGGGGGTNNFNVLDNRPKYKGVLMSGDTDIPEVITYSNFTGTDGTSAGSAGLVPAPAATDTDKYLKSDGTWAEVQGGGSGPTVVQTTGTSTTDVMSQNAVTSMVFADPGTGRQIKIGNSTNAGGTNSVAIGPLSNASSNAPDGVAIGLASNASRRGAIAIGSHSVASAIGEMNIGSSVTTDGYNNSNYRLLTGLYDPQSAHDAATKGYVDPTTDSSAPTSATAGRLGEIRIDTTTNTAYMCVLSDSTTPAYEWKQITA